MTPAGPATDVQRQAVCDYCGLPVPGAVRPHERVYCCFGCRFAADVTQASGETASQRWTALTLGLSVFLTMNVVMLTMALWSYAATPQSVFEAALADFLRYSALLFATPVLLMLGRPLAESALEQFRRGVWSTDLLLLTGVIAAHFVSAVTTIRGQGHVYFEVSCVILVLVTLGRWLEATGRLQASAALEQLERLIPANVRRVGIDGLESAALSESIVAGDRVRVLAGERIPVDGRVDRGRAVVDEQFFTGESAPVERQPGDRVLGGSLNLDGDLIVTATAPITAGALGRLVDAVRSARLAKGRFQILADRWSQFFFPIITVAAFATFAGHTAVSGWEIGLLTALSVVLIACPCALALATPLAIWAALAKAARRGVLFRSGEALERLAEVQAIRWDKTGTLTTGTPHVCTLVCEAESDRNLVAELSAELAATSMHTYSQAIREYLAGTAQTGSLSAVRTIAGRGLRAQHLTVGNVCLGSRRWMEESKLTLEPVVGSCIAESDFETAPQVFIGWRDMIRGVFILEETLRPEAVDVVHACREQGWDQAVLTGDRRERAAAVQTELQIPVHAELLPDDKLAAIREARNTFAAVAMVGDGLNDAPALAAADVGIALGCGADVTRDSADVCLLPNDLRLVPWALALSRDTVRTIRHNLCWSFGYNSLGVLVAALGWLHPALAAALMVVSSLMVLGNSLRLRSDDAGHDGSLPDTAAKLDARRDSLLAEAAS